MRESPPAAADARGRAALSRRGTVACGLASLAAGVGLTAAVPLSPQRWGLFLPVSLCLATVLFGLCRWLVTRAASRDATPASATWGRWAWLGYGLPLLIAGGFYLHAFWPALLSADSLIQWEQMVTGRYWDWHPIFHTLTNWLITRIWFSPSAVALVQLLALSILAAWILHRLRQWGMPRWLAATTSLLFALSPATGILAITLWKDIPYSIALLALTLFVMETIQSDGAWLKKKAAVICLGVDLALVALYRHNGLPIAVGLPLLLLLAYRRRWRGAVAAAAVAAILIVAVRGPLYRAVTDPQRGSFGQHGLEVMLSIQHVSAHLAQDTPLSDEERAFLDGLRPIGEGGWSYDPLCFPPAQLLDIGGNWEKWDRQRDRLFSLTASLFIRRPMVDLRHVIRSSALIWSITEGAGPDHSYYVAFAAGPPIRYQVMTGMTEGQMLADWRELRQPFPAWLARTFHRPWRWLLWRTPLHLYLMLLAVAVAMARSRSLRWALLPAPIGIHSLCLACAVPGQDFRLQFPVYLASFLFSGFLLLCVPRKPRG
jgi:hypothetical protein